MPTPEQYERAAQTYVDGMAAVAQMTPREHAEACWDPGCGFTVDQLEDQIREERGMPALDRAKRSA